ncbi:hypothetical protein GZH47_06095 [Paenibacillus rhizovicinus]|uniref:Uncharacterized protein n=1 Tax=Paenibacillus rhizovicinus TaxID=2704463 RepID=A0A6C0NWA6_9BACL|nr:hypothetical protein [Paenibacillus rhizovicinus]QHW30459.1 hypothetical protein GZH47_06095 [Paenibacillus rhizovicinus]
MSALAGYPSYASLYNMHLNSASSPAIDAGAVIPGVTNSYNGSAPDIGAYER